MEQITEVKKIVAYYRVSTRKQKTSGLGLTAQKEAVERFARERGATIEAEYKETESGQHTERVQLEKAIAHARLIKGTLVVAKLDRLSRNAAFTLKLFESGVDFVCCDNPHANRFTIQILAAVAEQESRAASIRTKEALAMAKQKGALLGSSRPGHWEGREHLRGWKKAVKMAALARTQRAKKNYELILPEMKKWRDEGFTLQEIADRLNERNLPTSTGKKFTTTTVWRILNGYPKGRKKVASS